jgi:hypothetical protein
VLRSYPAIGIHTASIADTTTASFCRLFGSRVRANKSPPSATSPIPFSARASYSRNGHLPPSAPATEPFMGYSPHARARSASRGCLPLRFRRCRSRGECTTRPCVRTTIACRPSDFQIIRRDDEPAHALGQRSALMTLCCIHSHSSSLVFIHDLTYVFLFLCYFFPLYSPREGTQSHLSIVSYITHSFIYTNDLSLSYLHWSKHNSSKRVMAATGDTMGSSGPLRQAQIAI